MRAEFREEPCKSALNRVSGMDFEWSLNPYMGCAHRCAFCYVRAFERRADRPSDDRYGASVRVKINVVDVLRRELSRRSWKRDGVTIGAATDPYQPAEGRYRLTRGCIEALGEHRNPFSIITRGPLVVRDIDVLTFAARRASVSVHLSVPTLDERVWRVTEPGTPPPAARIKAVAMLVRAGIKAAVAMAPILPGLSDAPEQLATVVRAARDAGATHLWAAVLHLNPGTREHFLQTLSREWPELLPRYEQLYAGGRAYLGREATAPATDHVKALRERLGIADRRAVRWTPPPEPAQMLMSL